MKSAVRVMLGALLVAGGLAIQPATAGAATEPDDLRINQIQVVGSHNSYKIEASPEESAVRRSFIGDGENLMQYGHVPLGEQFADQGIRQIELDIFRDDEGGKYANPLLRAVAGHGAYDPAMSEPGTKVLHIQDVDYRSTCLTLVDCLEAIETWSDANPDHLPIAVLLELKDSLLDLGDIPVTIPDPWTAAAMDALDEEILGVVPRDGIITPDDVRGDHDTLEDAVTTDGWPTVDESRGKVMFLMDNGGGYRTGYLQGHPTLEDRVLFTNASPGDPDAAFIKRNEPRGGNVAAIQALVEAGYVVRTRSDADTVEARENDTSARDAAFESGAQWVSTDYPVPEYAERFGTDFVVQIPGGGIARCNPVNAPAGCVDASIEPPADTDTGADDVVRFAYEYFLGRPGTVEERSTWVRMLDGGAERRVVVTRIGRSAEANRHNVDRVYQGLLDRPADTASRAYWGGRLDQGYGLIRHIATVAASAEAYGRAGGTDAAWVDALYQQMLGRGADAAGRAHFVGRLAEGTPRWRIARELLFSPEGRARIVTVTYTEVFGSAPSSAERQALVDQLTASGDPQALRILLVAT